ncbi:enoyl-CoA hydratase/isomerase family protein [Actinoplanes sp. NBC_00393]|uniref:enoyl-CoA hydratase/isomerase family protein n=1 Tax=Actinoplanes sp. NBC_00393 TaxID=2975953 RepID=UPI002E1C501E
MTSDAWPAPSPNGRHPPSAWTHLRVDRTSPGYCRVTFHHPPVNTITATTVGELTELAGLIEADPDLNVVVFDSAAPGFYLSHPDVPAGWSDVLVRVSRAPAVSIASIRGRAVGAAGEFVLACDLRFAARENTVLGLLPCGPVTARLARLVGRARALEIALLAEDLDAARAEQYGYVNRLFADDRLDDEVESIAVRIARLDHDLLVHLKSSVDHPV